MDLQFSAIASALARLGAEDTTGAVGARVLRTHGMLQEAGSIIWRDGSVQGYMRDAHPAVPEAGFVRAVDFCSGVFLMVRTDILRTLDGFDEAYAPPISRRRTCACASARWATPFCTILPCAWCIMNAARRIPPVRQG
ncbi:hypothetical protein RAA17_13725 [Komagataeibacter rhaeticus]|nr:hypothetical protein [Komagataeibacter rhaeticus]